MLGLARRENQSSQDDVAKLFFDRFSKRVDSFEHDLRRLGQELDELKGSSERSQVSDLVLLERIQRAEALLMESLGWMKRIVEIVSKRPTFAESKERKLEPVELRDSTEVTIGPIVSPRGVSESLSAITTPTEMQVLALLAEKGSLGAPEIGRFIGRSREHTARLMKQLYEEGYVKRDQNRIPFRYSLMDRVRQGFAQREAEARASTAEKETSPKPSEEGARVARPPPTA